MLIEQICELSRPGPPRCICTPKIGCFHDKTIICLEKFSSGLLFTAKILQGAVYFLLTSTWTKSLTEFNPKMQDFQRVLDLNCKQKKD